jgi:hypothetical protein
MKKGLLLIIIAVSFLTVSCASTGYNTQKGAAIGAGLGALAGQAIGHDTASTLIGAAVGGLAGVIGGNAVDQNVTNERFAAAPQPVSTVGAYSGAGQSLEPPPGQWVDVPGQWSGGRWVPSHKVWVPVNP